MTDLAAEKECIRKMYDGVYAAQARSLGRIIRDGVFGKAGNIGQNCILAVDDIEKLVEAGGIGREKKMLDTCCGDGSVAMHCVQKYACRMHGIDFSGRGIQAARLSAAELGMADMCDFRESEAEKMPYEEPLFDIVCSFDSFIHISDKKAVLRECARLLKPQGTLVLSDWINKGGVSAQVQSSSALWGYVYLATIEAYRHMLEEAGFEILHMADNSQRFSDIIAKWEQVNLSYRELLIDRCGVDYFEKVKKRWALARELSQSGKLGQCLCACRKGSARRL